MRGRHLTIILCCMDALWCAHLGIIALPNAETPTGGARLTHPPQRSGQWRAPRPIQRIVRRLPPAAQALARNCAAADHDGFHLHRGAFDGGFEEFVVRLDRSSNRLTN